MIIGRRLFPAAIAGGFILLQLVLGSCSSTLNRESVVAGPLTGLRIIEVGGIGPVPFAGMMLADHGAEVVRILRPGETVLSSDILLRSRQTVTLDLKNSTDIDTAVEMVRTADGLIEGFRPGVMERLGLGPDFLISANPRLVYGRMTGWGQTGPYAANSGHDLNYIAITGAAAAIGPESGKPVPPLNLVADFGGGGMLLAFSMVSALLHARSAGQGQVIDCAMSEGAGLLMAMTYELRAKGLWSESRGANLVDGGAPFYDVYETSDGHFVSIGAMEPQFYLALLEKLGLSGDPLFREQMDRAAWPEMRRRFHQIFLTRSRSEWCALLEHKDTCFAPVLLMSEAPAHPHAQARGSFVSIGGVIQPAPAPHYSVTINDVPRASTAGPTA